MELGVFIKVPEGSSLGHQTVLGNVCLELPPSLAGWNRPPSRLLEALWYSEVLDADWEDMKANGGFCNEVSGAWMLLWLGCLFKAASLCVGFEQLVIISVTPPRRPVL